MTNNLIKLARKCLKNINPVAYIARTSIRTAAYSFAHADSCLDIGAGTAPYFDIITGAFGVDNYIAMDVAPTDRCELVGDGCALPFRGESFDLVVCFDVIQHVVTPDLMVSEIARVLEPGGHCLLTFPFLYAECDFHDYHRWTMEGMRGSLERCGLKVVVDKRRGGLFFATALGLNWVVQHSIPGGRRSWRTSRTALGLLRAGMVVVMTLPTLGLAWIGLALDRFIPVEGLYMGGTVLAKKSKLFDKVDGDK